MTTNRMFKWSNIYSEFLQPCMYVVLPLLIATLKTLVKNKEWTVSKLEEIPSLQPNVYCYYLATT